MPRSVRNFWIEARVHGRKTAIATGPQSKDGGFNLTIKMRNKGSIDVPLDILGWESNGKLYLRVDLHGNRVFTVETER